MGLFNKDKVVATESVVSSSVAKTAPVDSIEQVNPEIGYFSGNLTPYGNLERGYRYRKNDETLKDKRLAQNLGVSNFEKELHNTYIPSTANDFNDYYNVIVENVLSGYINDSKGNRQRVLAENSTHIQIIPICEKCRSVPIIEIQAFTIYAGKVMFYCRNHKDNNDNSTMPLQEFFEYFPDYSESFVKHMKNFKPTVVKSDKIEGLRFVKNSDAAKVKKGTLNVFDSAEETNSKVENVAENVFNNVKPDNRIQRGEEFDNILSELIEYPYSTKSVFSNNEN